MNIDNKTNHVNNSSTPVTNGASASTSTVNVNVDLSQVFAKNTSTSPFNKKVKSAQFENAKMLALDGVSSSTKIVAPKTPPSSPKGNEVKEETMFVPTYEEKEFVDLFSAYWTKTSNDEQQPLTNEQLISQHVKNEIVTEEKNTPVSKPSEDYMNIEINIFDKQPSKLWRTFLWPFATAAKIVSFCFNTVKSIVTGVWSKVVKPVIWTYTTQPVLNFISKCVTAVWSKVVKPFIWTYTTQPVLNFIKKCVTAVLTFAQNRVTATWNKAVKPIIWEHTTKPCLRFVRIIK